MSTRTGVPTNAKKYRTHQPDNMRDAVEAYLHQEGSFQILAAKYQVPMSTLSPLTTGRQKMTFASANLNGVIINSHTG